MKYIPASGPIGAKIMLVVDSPTYDDTDKGKLLHTSRDLDVCLKEAGLRKDNLWLSSVSKYHVPSSNGIKKIPFAVRAKNAGIDIETQLAELQVEINAIKPNVIVALGGASLWALTGKKETSIGNYRGSILSGLGCKVIPTYNPRDLSYAKGGEIKGYWNRQVIQFDFRRVLLQSKFLERNLPVRNLQVCRNSHQLADFIERHQNEQKLSIDIEALNCIPTCIGLAFNRREGLSIPLWNCNGISHIPDADISSIWYLLAKVLADARFKKIGQNFKYDEDKIKRLGFTIDSLYSDTMLKAFTINPELPKSLAFNTSIYTEEPYYKDEGADFNPHKQSVDDLFIYNARDACVTLEIDDAMDADLDEMHLTKFYHNFVMKLHSLYEYIENEGFTIDYKKREELLAKYIHWSEVNQYRMFNLSGVEINVDSPKQIGILLYETLGLKNFGGTGEEVLTQLLNSKHIKNKQHEELISLILETRSVNKTIGNYIMALPDYDGKMKTTYFLCNRTARTSTGQQDPPIRPSMKIFNNKGKLKEQSLGTAFQTMTKHGDIGADVREQYVAEEGYVFIQADSSQAEARVVFLLADDEQALEDIDKHDYHALTASWFFGGTEDDYSKKKLGFESPIRFAGKTLRHAGHLGAGAKRAATELNTQARKYKIPITITETIAGNSLKIFHLKQPKIQKVFQASVIQCIQKTRKLVAGLPYGIDAETGGQRIFFERDGDELYREALSYIPQRSVTDNTKAAGLRIRDRAKWIRIILEAHDALLCMVPINRIDEAAAIIKPEMEREIDFSRCSIQRRNLSIPCELESGTNYANLSKFRGAILPVLSPT